uniref:Uncharacterized protein n=1 Tax=Acrobeloides nanus TaxID=290746 RepID=A0A914DX01_9BILA
MVDPKKANSTLNDDKKESFASKTTKQSLRVANETVKITKSRSAVGCRYVIDKPSRGSTVLRIKDIKYANPAKGQYGIPVVRIDKAGGKVPYNHININTNNPKLAGFSKNLIDPHIPISNGVIVVAEKIVKFQNFMQKTNKVMLPVAIVLDTARVVWAIKNDIKSNGNLRKPKETIKTVGSVAGGWGGGLAGAFAGGEAGVAIGTAIGTFFGSVGAIPGAAIGGIVGSITGSIAAGIGGSFAGEKIGKIISEKAFDGDQREYEALQEDENNIEDNIDEEEITIYQERLFLSMENLYEPKDDNIENSLYRFRAMTL